MKEKAIFIFKNLLLFIFFLSLFTYFCHDNSSYDFLWNYGFSHAIRIGEIPYLDFNMVSTPLYNFLMAIGLFFWDNFLTFMICQAILCTILFNIFLKCFGKKGWLFLPIMSFPIFRSFIGTYNFLALLLIVSLFYLEKKKKSDFYIGLLLGLLFFSKQTIGGVVILLNLFFLHDKKRILKRLSGIAIPFLLFLIYFLITKSLYSFIDLCFLSLLDFAEKNGKYLNILMFLSLAMLIYTIYNYIKERDIKYSYVMGSFFFAFPIFDYYHFSLYLTAFALIIVPKINISENYLRNLSFLITGLTLILCIFFKNTVFKDLAPIGLNHFEYYLVPKQAKKELTSINNVYQKYDHALMLGYQAMFFDIVGNKKITYFDISLTGNYGYGGTKKMIEKVDQMHDQYFFIDIERFKYDKNNTQIDYHLLKHIIENSKLVTSVQYYNIYYKE